MWGGNPKEGKSEWFKHKYDVEGDGRSWRTSRGGRRGWEEDGEAVTGTCQ